METALNAGPSQTSGLEKTITVVRGEGSLGMTVNALRDGSCMIIRTVVNGGSISKDGRLGVGDGIVAINGEPTCNLTNAQARAMLRRHSLIGPDLSLTYVPAASLDMHRATVTQWKQETNVSQADVIQLKTLPMDRASVGQSKRPTDAALRTLGHISELTKVDGGRVNGRNRETEQVARQTSWGREHDGTRKRGQGGGARDGVASRQESRPRGAEKESGSTITSPALQQSGGDPQDQSSRVTLIRKNGESLGISITGGRGMGSRLSNGEVKRGIFIKHIAEDSPAARNSTLKAGDRILQVGSVDVSALTHEAAVEAIRQAGNQVQLIVQHQQVSDATTRQEEDLSHTSHENRSEGEIASRHLVRLPPAYPATPSPFKPTESRLLRKPPQAVLPPLRLPSGPVGTVTDGVTTKNVFERRSGPPETTQHSEQEQAPYWKHMLERYGSLPGEMKIVELDCSTHSSGLGVCVTGIRDTAHGKMSVYVSEVRKDGAAAADGRIQVGDELLEINGRILYGGSHHNATAVINSTRSKAMIVLLRNKVALRHMTTGAVMETDSSTILSTSAVDISVFKEDKHDTVLNQEGRPRSEDKQRTSSSVKSSVNHPVSFNTSCNHKPLNHPVPTFNSSSSSYITPGSYTLPTSQNIPANHTQTIHYTPSPCGYLANHIAIGLPSPSYCPSCSGSYDPLTRPVIPGCLNTIDICKGPSGLGLTIVGGCNTLLGAILIQEVNEDGAARRDGRLMAGDHILEVNGIDLRMATHEEALSILRLSPHLVRLCVYRQPCAHSTHTFQSQAPHVHDMWDLFRVDLHIGPRQNLGLNIVGKRNDIGIFVSEIMKGGVVEMDGRLLPGDQILSVNGEDIRAVTQDHARALLQNCRGSVVLEVARFKANPHYSYECEALSPFVFVQDGDSHASSLPTINIYNAVEGPVDIRTATFEKGSCDSPGLRASVDAGLKEGADLHATTTESVRASAHAGLLEGVPRSEDDRSAWRRSSPDLCNTQSSLSFQYQTISLESGSVDLGISVSGGLHSSHGNQPIYIKNVFPKKLGFVPCPTQRAAAEDNRLQPGDQLLAVNGRSLRGVTHAEAMAILRHAGSPVTLSVLPHTHPTHV